ncbi:GntR family transcriptional regulator [Aquicoccus sp. G2-2]|uniref:GntR family transcriptional regulator n=1 Tax=Aquicoccus sp. G2-2 TaxID=3092120 RepID=UPI002AE09B0A|nr:GntR family transcriptional regulator [Aquicoccus sp. G2-2]MEA1112165.1 GntR family transcriptional regulator [Aquicoccus sp. G2-2]
MSDSKKPKRATNRDTASGIIVSDVIRGLYEGYYVAGQRLVEPDLMERYGLSRGSTREALKEMAADGIVTLQPFRGAQIRKLTRREAANIFSITEVILGLAARQAAAHINEGDARAKLSHALSGIEKHADDSDRFAFIQHRNFYFRTLVDINHNDELWRLLPKLQVHLIRNRLAMPPQDRVQGYREMTEAILTGNEDAAEDAARRYVRKTAAAGLPDFPQ